MFRRISVCVCVCVCLCHWNVFGVPCNIESFALQHCSLFRSWRAEAGFAAAWLGLANCHTMWEPFACLQPSFSFSCEMHTGGSPTLPGCASPPYHGLVYLPGTRSLPSWVCHSSIGIERSCKNCKVGQMCCYCSQKLLTAIRGVFQISHPSFRGNQSCVHCGKLKFCIC